MEAQHKRISSSSLDVSSFLPLDSSVVLKALESELSIADCKSVQVPSLSQDKSEQLEPGEEAEISHLLSSEQSEQAKAKASPE